MKDEKTKAARDAGEPVGVSEKEASAILAEFSNQLEAARKEAREYKDSYLRARADYDNLKKRAERDAADMVRLGKSDFMLKVLDAADDLERALAADAGAGELRTGLELTLRKLLGILRTEGLEPIEAVGKPFDPSLHEAVAASEGDVECDTVCDELRKGYTYCGCTLRPTIVRVAVPKKA